MKGLGTAAASAAVILLSGVGGASAADLPVKAAYKAPADGLCTSILDFLTTACQVAAYGVRFYGTLDYGLTYETHGTPMNKFLGVNSFLGKASNDPRFITSPGPSNIGFQVKEPLGAGWSFVGQVESGFNPYSLTLLNGVHSVFDAIGKPLGQQNAFGDSNSEGKFYNNLGFTGVSNDTWGTLTVFRQNDLAQDAFLSYDPLGVNAAFSPLGFFGSFAGGGATENRRDTTALKYRVNVANWHAGAYWQFGGYNQGNASNGGYQGDIGADFNIGPGLLSFDVIGAFKKDAVALGAGLSGPVDQNGFPIDTGVGGLLLNPTAACLATGKGCVPINFLSSIISNNTSVVAVAKYQVDRWKFYAGYEHIEFANPSDPQTSFIDIAGDLLCQNCNVPVLGVNGVFNGTQITNNFYNTHKIDQLAWAGAKYALTDSIDVTAAYYHEWNNDFTGNPATCAVSSTASGKCAGTKDTVSATLYWHFAPKWDTYVGTNYNRNAGGTDSGYLQKDVLSTTAGLRFRW